MNAPLDRILQNLVGRVANAAGANVAGNPDVQAAIAQAKSEYAKLNVYGEVAVVAGGLIFLFYFLPRFENPIPRVMRRRK